MATNTRALRTTTAHTRAIPGSCSQLSTATAFYRHVLSYRRRRPSSRLTLFKAHACLSPPSLSLSHTTNQTEATLSTAVCCDRPIMSDSTTKLAEKQCYPDTEALRTTVGEFFAHDSRSFTASKNSEGKQKTYFCSGKEGGCEALQDYLYY